MSLSVQTGKAVFWVGVALNKSNYLAMTISELRAFPNCGHYTDEQAENVVRTLDKLATVIFDYTCKECGIVIDNQIVINEKEEENS